MGRKGVHHLVEESIEDSGDSDEDANLPPLVPNQNHRVVEYFEESEDSEED